MRSRLMSLGLTPAASRGAASVAWKAYVEVNDVSRFVLPPPDDVGAAGSARCWATTPPGTTLWVTLQEILLGLRPGDGLRAWSTGALLGEFPILDRALTPFLVVPPGAAQGRDHPSAASCGWASDCRPRSSIAAVFAFFPITVGTRAGLRSVDPGHRDLARDAAGRPVASASGWWSCPSALPADPDGHGGRHRPGHDRGRGGRVPGWQRGPRLAVGGLPEPAPGRPRCSG